MRIARVLLFSMIIAAAGVGAEAAEPLPCADKLLNNMRFLIGEWDFVLKTPIEVDQWLETTGTSTVTTAVGDCVLVEKVESTRGERAFESMRLYTVRANGQGLQLAIMDTEHKPIFVYESYAVQPRVFTVRVTAPGRGVVMGRQRYTEVTQDRFLLINERSKDGGRIWDEAGTYEYRRRGTAAAADAAAAAPPVKP